MIFIPDAEFIVAECPGDAEDTPSARQGREMALVCINPGPGYTITA